MAVGTSLDEWRSFVLLFPFVIGILSGGQSIHGKQGSDFLSVLKSGWGWIYWLSRGIIPMGTYVAWFFAQSPPKHSIWTAVVCGLGSEAVVRSKLYLGTSKTADGKSDDNFRGLFDLIEWWQALCLRQAGIAGAAARLKLVRDLVGSETDFPALSQRVQANAAPFPQDVQDEIDQKLTALQADFATKFAATPAAGQATLHKTFIFKLGYTLLGCVGKGRLGTLVQP